MNNEQRIAFIGPKEYCNAMRFVGFECFGAFDEGQALGLIKKLKNENYVLIFVSQDIAPKDVGFDRVVVLPGMVKSSDPEYLKQEITKAIGGEINLSLKP